MKQRAKWVSAATLVLLFGWAGWALAPSHQLATNPLLQLVRDAADSAPLTGRVEQRLDAGSYTYLALRTDAADRVWAVTMGRGAPPGSRVLVRSMGRSTDFYSRRLQRRFPELVFGIVSRVD